MSGTTRAAARDVGHWTSCGAGARDRTCRPGDDVEGTIRVGQMVAVAPSSALTPVRRRSCRRQGGAAAPDRGRQRWRRRPRSRRAMKPAGPRSSWRSRGTPTRCFDSCEPQPRTRPSSGPCSATRSSVTSPLRPSPTVAHTRSASPSRSSSPSSGQATCRWCSVPVLSRPHGCTAPPVLRGHRHPQRSARRHRHRGSVAARPARGVPGPPPGHHPGLLLLRSVRCRLEG